MNQQDPTAPKLKRRCKLKPLGVRDRLLWALLVVLFAFGPPATVVHLMAQQAPPSTGGQHYVIMQSTGSLLGGTTDTGSHCDDCVTTINLPFTYNLYGQAFTQARINSNGTLLFTSSDPAYMNSCLANSGFSYTIFPHWDDLLTLDPGTGVFTSIYGTAPNRTFVIEWRVSYFINRSQRANFEIALHENAPQFDIVYGQIDQGGAGATVGVQLGSEFSEFECNAGGLVPGLKLTFAPGGQLPVANVDAYAGVEDSPLSVDPPGVLANDTDPYGNTLSAALVTPPAHSSSFIFNADGSFIYAPAANFNGTDSFTYKASDGTADSEAVAVTITVAGVNDRPTFSDAGNVSIPEDFGPAIVSGWASGINAGPANESGQAVTFLIVGNSNPGLFAVAPAIDPNGNLTFAAPPNANGSSTITVVAKDNGGTANGGADTSVAHAFTITVTPQNDDPIAANDSANTVEDTPLTLAAAALLANDSDIDGDTLSIASVSPTSLQGGSVVLSAGSVVYTPPANFNGTDTFTYTLSDGHGGSATATVSVNVSSVNDAPVANAQTLTIDEDTTANITLSGSDVDGDPLTFSIVSAPSHGTLGGTPPNLTYTPTANYNGSDSFTFKANDGRVYSAPASVTITVTPVNDNPVAANDDVTVNEDSAGNVINVLANDSIAPDVGETLTVVAVTQGAHGSVAIVAGGTAVTYTPAPDFFGSDSFDYTIADGNGGSATATVNVTVLNVNDAPVLSAAQISSETVNENDWVTISGSLTDADPDDAHTVTIAWGDGTDNEVINLSAGQQTFTATHQYLDDKPSSTPADINTITCTVSDGNGGNVTETATVMVKNLAPVITGVAGPTGPLALGSSASVSVNFTDEGTLDTHTVRLSWDDGTADTILSTGGLSRSASHSYAAAGVYTVGVSVMDDDTGVASTTYEYIVVYDPSAGFVTGGGWITSPPGAYSADPALSGKASFGFVSKYLKGATTPSGQTEFQFQVANFNFHSSSYEWLVVSGPLAQYKGSGAVNGAGDYGFLLTATDGQIAGSGGVDRFRIKIWDKTTGAIVYDNAMGASDDINSGRSQAIGGGSIVIQKAK